MATNLRLLPETQKALRSESERSGRSQQDIIRRALDEYLGLVPSSTATIDELVAAGVVTAPRPLRPIGPRLTLAPGMTTERLLDREDRF